MAVPLAALPLVMLPLSLFGCSSQPVTGAGQVTPTPAVSVSVTASGTPGPAGSASTTPAPPGGPSTSKTMPSSAGLTITRTGGLAGVQQILAIATDGTWTYADKRTGDIQQGKLTTTQRQDLARLMADPALPAESRVSPADTCADGYLYGIAIGELTIRVNQCGEGKRPVTQQLLTLVLAATPL